MPGLGQGHEVPGPDLIWGGFDLRHLFNAPYSQNSLFHGSRDIRAGSKVRQFTIWN